VRATALKAMPGKAASLVRRRILVGALLTLLLLSAMMALRTWRENPLRGLPYRDSFAAGKAEEWRAFGGTWELVDGAMRNDSDERGAKLLSGSPWWHNYSIEADIYLLGNSGDAGLTIRSGDEEEGVNAYRGYYAGVRITDNSLVLGRADHGWMEVAHPSRIPEGIRPFQWYHLKLLAYDCQIVAAFGPRGQPARTALGITDDNCVRFGRVGLRSYSSGGIWRNVVIRPTTHQDLVAIQASAGGRDSSLRSALPETPDSIEPRPALNPQQQASIARAETQSIASLRLTSFAKPASATVRGVVVLTTPRLYVQDSSGGVYIPKYKGPLLKVGDEVEAAGEAHAGDFSSTIDDATVQVLWARTPMPPVSVTASQASTGKYDATFIEVRGVLTGKDHGPGNTLILDLDQGPQSFRAILNPGRSDYLFDRLKIGSILRLRGICVVDAALTHNLTPFVLLLRSNEDLDVIAGPPWWSTGHIVAIVVAVILLAFVAVVLYHRIENWRLRAILDERSCLAHEMHDTLAQSFAGIGFQLQAIRNGLPGGMPALQQQIELASDLVRHSHEEARRSIATLRIETLQSEDIVAALEASALRMIGGSTVHVICETDGNARPIPLRTRDTLYRIGQEAVANAVRHANPTQVILRLRYNKNSVCLYIEDDGPGFVPGSSVGFGIRGMRRRAQSVSATFQLESQPGTGTRIRVEAPLPPRMTFTSWPRLFWKYMMEYWWNARATRAANSHPYRG